MRWAKKQFVSLLPLWALVVQNLVVKPPTGPMHCWFKEQLVIMVYLVQMKLVLTGFLCFIGLVGFTDFLYFTGLRQIPGNAPRNLWE